MTDHGRNQAKALVKKLTSRGINKIFSSPKIRAYETADIISKKLNLPVEIIDDLRERNAYGVLTGLTKIEAKERFPREVISVQSYKNTVTGAESYRNFCTRIKNTIAKIANENSGTIAIISHGGLMHAIHREILELGEIDNIADCAFMVIKIDDDNWELVETDGISKRSKD